MKETEVEYKENMDLTCKENCVWFDVPEEDVSLLPIVGI